MWLRLPSACKRLLVELLLFVAVLVFCCGVEFSFGGRGAIVDAVSPVCANLQRQELFDRAEGLAMSFVSMWHHCWVLS